MTINITFIAVWIAQFNLYLWKRSLPKYYGSALDIAETKIALIERNIEHLKGLS